MPFRHEWVDPEIALKHRGLTVYHTYKYDDIGQGPRWYTFTLNPDCGEDSCLCAGTCKNVFDVRELPNWVEPPHPPILAGPDDTPENRKAWDRWRRDRVEEKHIRAVIQEAIDRGFLSKEGRKSRRGPSGPAP
jgi:hypothetical protein